MSGLIPKFLANLEQLEENQIPKTNSGKKIMLIFSHRKALQKAEIQRREI